MNINYDELFEILLRLPFQSILRYCEISKLSSNICKDKYLWAEKASIDFGVPYQDFFDTNLNPIERYVEILTINGQCIKGSERYISSSRCLYQSAKNGDFKSVQYFLSITNNHNPALRGASNGGHLDLVKYLIEKYKFDIRNINFSVKAAKNGTNNLDIANYLFSNGSTNYKDLLFIAGYNGDFDFIENILNKIFPFSWNNENFIEILFNNYKYFSQILDGMISGNKLDDIKSILQNYFLSDNKLLYNIAHNGTIEMFQYISDRFANLDYIVIGNVVELAAKSGNFKLVDYINKNGNYINQALVGSAENGNIDRVKYYISKGSDNFDQAFEAAVTGGNLQIIYYLSGMIEDIPNAILFSLKHNNNKITIFLIDLMLNKGETYFDNIFEAAIENENLYIIDYLIKNTKISKNILDLSLLQTAINGELEITKYLIEVAGADINPLYSNVNDLDSNIVEYLKNYMIINNFGIDLSPI